MRPILLRCPDGDPGDSSPEFDAPGPARLRQVLVIASSPRTGSALLSRALIATGQAGVPLEYLNPHAQATFVGWRRRWNLPSPTLRGRIGMLKRRAFGDPTWWKCYRWSPASMHRYLEQVVAHRTTPNGVFALKVHGSAFREWTAQYGLDLNRWSVPVSWVHLERDDLLAQAVSFTIATQTRKFSSLQSAQAVPTYDPATIEARLASSRVDRGFWRRYFQEQRIEPLQLTYERLVSDYEGSVRAVLELVDVDIDVVPPPQLERLSNHVNHEWIERFTEERPDLAHASRGAAL